MSAGFHDKVKSRVLTLEDLTWWRLEYGFARYYMGELEKKCDGCRAFKPMTEEFFRPNSKKLDGLDFACRECMEAGRRAYGTKHWVGRKHTPESRQKMAEKANAMWERRKERAAISRS